MPLMSPYIKSPYTNVPLVSPARKSMLGQSNFNDLAYEDFQTTPVKETRSLIENELRNSRAKLCVSEFQTDQTNLSLQMEELRDELEELKSAYQPPDVLYEQLSGEHRYFEDKFERIYEMMEAAPLNKPKSRGVELEQFVALADSVAAQFSDIHTELQGVKLQFSDDMRDKIKCLSGIPLSTLELLGGLESAMGILGTRLNKCENSNIMQRKQIDALLNVIDDENEEIMALRAALEAEVQRSVLAVSRRSMSESK